MLRTRVAAVTTTAGAAAILWGAALVLAAGPPPRRFGPESPPVARYTGLAAPESVLYDRAGDRYLVSNVNGAPLARDNNGFISVLSPQGKVVARTWIAGGRPGVVLDAPKGLAIKGNELFVADLSVVRVFDLTTGAPRGEIAVPGSTDLTDLAARPDGTLYVTDAGPPTGRFDGEGTEAVHVIEGGRARPLATGNKLGRPHGLAWTEAGVVVSPFGASEIYRLNDKGEKRDVTQTPAGGLAGVVSVGDVLFVTSWQSKAVYRGTLGGSFEVALAGQKSPADLGYDSRRGRLLVPHFQENTVEAFELR
jgi:hypothetical protein